MKLISLNEWVERGKLLPGRRLLESEEGDVLDNILALICSPDAANFELAEQIAKGQFEEDNPALYKKLLALFNHDALKIDGVYFKKIEKTGQGDFNLTFNSTEDVNIPYNMVKNGKLIYQFDKVDGHFYCYNNGLTTLEGCPQIVGGNFLCSHNKLTSLEGGPKTVGGYFGCFNNQLTSLEGCPQTVKLDFDCSNNKTKFTEQDVRSVCDVKGRITV